MKTKLLSAAGCTAVLLAAGAAQAQVPIANTYYSGQHGEYVAVALQNSGGPHVLFMDSSGDYEWYPFSPSIWQISGSYGKRHDAVAYYAVMDGNGAWEFDTQSWYPLGTPGAWATDDSPTIYKEIAVFGEEQPGYGEPGLTKRYLPGNGTTHHLFNNGRHERRPNLFEETVAYEYDDGGVMWVSVHDLQNDVELYNAKGLRPDVVNSLVVHEDGGGSIHYEDCVSGIAGQLPPPPGCGWTYNPLIGGWGQWIIYTAKCNSGMELWLHEIGSGADQFIDWMNPDDEEFFHTVGEWLVYSDVNEKVVLIEFGPGGGSCDVPYMPAAASWSSGLIGSNPTMVLDNNGKWHDLFASGSNTIDWIPGNAPNAVGPAMSWYDGVYYTAAAVYMGNVWSYDVDVGAWTWIAAGGTTPTMYKDFLAWTHNGDPSDRAIGWGVGSIGSFSTGVSFAANGTHEQRPAVFEQTAALEQLNGTWDVTIVDVQSESLLASFGGSGNQTEPDLWGVTVAYVDDVQGLRWVENYYTGVSHPVPTSSACCTELRNPRLGYDGKWIFYEAAGCSHGKSELRVVSMGSGIDHMLDFVAPAGSGQPQYSAVDKQLVYVNDSGQVIHVELDNGQI